MTLQPLGTTPTLTVWRHLTRACNTGSLGWECAVRFEVIAGPDLGRAYEFMHEAVVLIGRDPAAEICLRDARCSRHHARATREADGVVLVDLGSANGTLVNGRRNPKAFIRP